MSEVAIQKEILDTLTGLKDDMDDLKKDMHEIKEHLEDTHLTEEERRQLEKSMAKIRAGDESEFTSLEEVKDELGI